MGGTHDTDETATPNDADGLEPRQAERLLAQTKRDARRRFNRYRPWSSTLLGALVLVAYGELWLSVRGQHPYTGPSLMAVGLCYAAVVVSAIVGVAVHRRAMAGVSGRSVRLSQREGAALLVSLLGSPLLQGALKFNGAGDAIVYGVIPAAGPLIILGTTLLGMAAIKADWPQFGAALAVVAGGVVAAFAGPIDGWLAAGIALLVGIAGYAVATSQRLGGS